MTPTQIEAMAKAEAATYFGADLEMTDARQTVFNSTAKAIESDLTEANRIFEANGMVVAPVEIKRKKTRLAIKRSGPSKPRRSREENRRG